MLTLPNVGKVFQLCFKYSDYSKIFCLQLWDSCANGVSSVKHRCWEWTLWVWCVWLYRSGLLCMGCSRCKSQTKESACVWTSVFLKVWAVQWGLRFPGRPAVLSCTKDPLSLTVKSCGQCTGTFHGRSVHPQSVLSSIFLPCMLPVSFAIVYYVKYSAFSKFILCESNIVHTLPDFFCFVCHT